ncbi:hypothetical protein FKM82_016324 [Ascaphus truei]
MSVTAGPDLLPYVKNSNTDAFSSPEAPVNDCLYVGNLSIDVTEEDLFILFKDYRPRMAKKCQRDRKCFAFVYLNSPETVLQVISNLHETMFMGRRLILKPYCGSGNGRESTDSYNRHTAIQDLESAPAPELCESFGDKEARSRATVYIGNLPFATTESDILMLLKEYGPVNVKRHRHDIKCYAFVQLSSPERVPLAINQINGVLFGGRRVICNHVTAQESVGRPPESSEKQMPELEDVPASELCERPIPDDSKDRRENEVYVGNLPVAVTEEELLTLFKNYEPVRIWKPQRGMLCFAVVQLCSPESASLAINQLSGTVFKRCRLILVSKCATENGRNPESPNQHMEMPELESVPTSDLDGNNRASCGIGDSQLDVPVNKNIFYAIPMEMRGMILSHMLRDCFNDINWLAAIMETRGEVALLVTNVFPPTPFFFAVHLTKGLYSNMTKLFSDLAEVEFQQPYLLKSEVQRGTRGLAECILVGGEEGAWNRCWVIDVVLDLAIVFIFDYGLTANVPLKSLRRLDRDDLWVIPPLAQPFMLEEGCCSCDFVRTIVKGKISGFCKNERHILMFSKYAEEEWSWKPNLSLDTCSI